MILPVQKGEHCTKERNAGTSFSGVPVSLMPTICARLAYFALGADSIILVYLINTLQVTVL